MFWVRCLIKPNSPISSSFVVSGSLNMGANYKKI